MLNSFALIQRESYGQDEVWVRKVLLLFSCFTKEESEDENLALVRYIQCVSPLDALDRALRYVCLQYAPAGSASKERDIEGQGENRDALVAGEWFRAIPVQSNVSKVHVARSYIAVQPFGTELPWKGHCLYTNSFLRESAVEEGKVHR